MKCTHCGGEVSVKALSNADGEDAGDFVGCEDKDCDGSLHMHPLDPDDVHGWKYDNAHNQRYYSTYLGYLSCQSFWPEYDREVIKGVIRRVIIDGQVKKEGFHSVTYTGCIINYTYGCSVGQVTIASAFLDTKFQVELKKSIYSLKKGDKVEIIKTRIGREPKYPHLGGTSSEGWWGLKHINKV